MIRLRIGHSSRMHNTWCKEIKHDGEGERWEVKIGQMIGSIWWKGQEWKKALKGDFYCSNYNADDSQGVQEASYDNSVDRCYAMPVYNPVLQLLWGGECLQVDELVHQQQGAGQAGKAGFRAATVTARVASWNWPRDKKGGEEAKGSRRIQANRGEEGRRSGSHIKQSKQGGERSRKRKEKERAEFTHFLLQVFKHYFDWACRIIQLAGLRLSKYHCDSFFSGTIFPILCLEESVKTYLGNSFGLWRE